MPSYNTTAEALANLGPVAHPQIEAHPERPKPVKVPKPPPHWQEVLFKLLCHERPDLEWVQNSTPFPDRKWELDIVAPSILFAVEVDGGVHAILKQRISDAQKLRRWHREGGHLTRVVNEELKLNLDATLREVLEELERWERRNNICT